MPPAPTTRASRPSSIYSSGPASSSKKRSSVSPADPSQMQPQATKPSTKKHVSPCKARVLATAIHNQQKVNVVPAPSKSRSVRNQNRLLYEDEYSDEVTAYMHLMEVSALSPHAPATSDLTRFRLQRWRLPSSWTCSPNSNGTCDLFLSTF